MYEPPLHKLQQAVPHVSAQSPAAAPGQPGVPGGAQMAAGLVPQGLRLLPEVSGGTRQRAQTLAEVQLGLPVLLQEVRVGPGALLQPALTRGGRAGGNRLLTPFLDTLRTRRSSCYTLHGRRRQ